MPHRNIFKKILFCTDFSGNAEAAFFYALNIAEGNPSSRLVILHIVPEPDAQFWKSYLYEVEDVDAKAEDDMGEKIRKEYIAKIPDGIEYSVRTETGKAEQQILRAAALEEADLIVIGRGSRGGLTTLFFGKTTEHVARRAGCPVLIVPPAE
jgi:nucleotide-binding universal stress UspA family protein